jgi:hypothetical protein
VLIGHHERVAWLASPAGAAASDAYGERLSTALEGHEVLAYTTDPKRLASLRPRTAGAALQRRGLADRSCSLECSLDHYARALLGLPQ